MGIGLHKLNAKEIMQQAAPRNESYHLAQSSDIGHAAICGLKFKLPRVMGPFLKAMNHLSQAL